jgi:hypothetical protein
MHSVDEVTYTAAGYARLLELSTLPKGAPMPFDQTGIKLGAMKVKGASR